LKVTPNLILIAILLLLIFEKEKNITLFSAFLGGIFLDISSGFSFGVATLSLVLIYFFLICLLKIFLKIDFSEVALIIVLGTILYNLFIPSFSYLSGLIFGPTQTFQFNLNYVFLIEIMSNLILGIIIFSIIKYGFFQLKLTKRVK
jgi:rod shape-determining protein MreD